jgi:hypothetical protein
MAQSLAYRTNGGWSPDTSSASLGDGNRAAQRKEFPRASFEREQPMGNYGSEVTYMNAITTKSKGM